MSIEFFPCSFTFSLFICVNISTEKAKSQGQSLSYSSEKSSVFPIDFKTAVMASLSSRRVYMLYPSLTSAHENGTTSPGDRNQFSQES